MPETDTIPVSASIASPGLGIRYVSNWAYGYSGILSIDNIETTMLEFLSGSGVLVADIQPFYAQGSGGDNYFYQIYLNDIAILGFAADGAVNPFGYGTTDIKLILPPLTKFKFTAQNAVDSDSNNQAVTIVGRVYGA